MSTSLRRTRVAAALAMTSIALTSCASSVRDGSADESPSALSTPSSYEHSTSPRGETGEPTPTEDTDELQITGDYETDVLATGYEPDDFDELMGWFEGHLCDDPMGKGEDQLFNSYDRWIQRMATDDQIGPDLLRVVVEYRCPERSEALDNILDRT